jgi:hypothetical protein
MSNRQQESKHLMIKLFKAGMLALSGDAEYTESKRVYLHLLGREIVRATEHGSEVHNNGIQELAQEIKDHVV